MIFFVPNTVTIDKINGTIKAKSDVKQKIADDFNAGKVDILLGQIGAMGVSLNIQELANYVIFAEADWSPAAMEQAWHRVWRMGQTRHVQVDICYADHPIDDAVKRTLTTKDIGQKRIIG